MFSQNEKGIERLVRLTIGSGLLFYGYYIAGNYWMAYQPSTYQVPCLELANFMSNGCLIERGIICAIIGLIPFITGLIGWCPLKAILRITPYKKHTRYRN